MSSQEMSFFMNESKSDVVFVIKRQRLPAITSILSLKSIVFRAMFSGDFNQSKEAEESKLPEIEIKDTTFDAFKTLIRFIYTDEVVLKDPNDWQQIWDVSQLAIKYQVLRLHLRVCLPTKGTHKEMSYECLPEMSFFMNESKSDVVFVIDGQRLPAIKAILSLKSRVFEAVFSVNFSESNESKLSEIEIKDTTFDVFKTLIRFIYTDELVLKYDKDFQHIWDVLQLADRHEILRLRQRVGQHFESIITLKDLISISRVVFTNNIEELMAKVMSFIEKNINELIEWNLKDLKELNELTNNKLLDVLLTGRLLRTDNIKPFVVQKKTVFVKWDVIHRNHITRDLPFVWFGLKIRNRSYEAFKTFMGFLYFNKLILKDEDDLQVIREVCRIFYGDFKSDLFFNCIENYLKQRITVENVGIISGMAFGYQFKGLIERVNEFINENITEIVTKSNKQLFEINDLTQNKLLSTFANFIRNSNQNNV